jgi:hypothetical protein
MLQRIKTTQVKTKTQAKIVSTGMLQRKYARKKAFKNVRHNPLSAPRTELSGRKGSPLPPHELAVWAFAAPARIYMPEH